MFAQMLRAGFKAAAFNITGFILILGSIYVVDLPGFKGTFGYVFLGVGLVHLAYIVYTYYLYQKLKFPAHYLLYLGALCIFTMAVIRLSLENWETPTLLFLLGTFVLLCARQLHGKLNVFPKPRKQKK